MYELLIFKVAIMKLKNFTLVLIAVFALNSLHAQLEVNEDFDYPVDRPLVLNPIAGEANYDETTDWWTARNSRADVVSFTMAEGSLVYEGYSSGVGNSLYYDGTNGPGFHKEFPEEVSFQENETFYVSFLIQFDDVQASGTDYFFGIKMDRDPGSFNWGGRIFARNDMFTAGKFDIGINKSDSPAAEWTEAGDRLNPNETYLFVMRYDIGDVAESRAAQDEEGYEWDDVMRVYINPDLSAGEPEVASIHHEDAGLRDIRRWGATSVFGGASAIYKRSPAEGAAPTYRMDAIRVGRTWEDVVPVSSSIAGIEAQNSDFKWYVENGQIHLSGLTNAYDGFELIGLTGQTRLTGRISGSASVINSSSLGRGIYILKLSGDRPAAAKIVIP